MHGVSLVDEDTNSILAEDTNRAIPGNLEMQVAPYGDLWIKCKWRHQEAKFVTSYGQVWNNANSAI